MQLSLEACVGSIAGLAVLCCCEASRQRLRWLLRDWQLARRTAALRKNASELEAASLALPTAPSSPSVAASPELVALCEYMASHSSKPTLRSVRVETEDLQQLLGNNGGGTELIDTGVQAHWVTYPGVQTDDTSPVVLFIHGGGLVTGSPTTYAAFTSELSRLLNCPVVCPAYRLIPQHTIHDAVSDVFRTYKWLVRKGYRHVVVVGESTGATLATLLLQKLSTTRHRQPACAVLISPTLDHTHSTRSHKDNRSRDLSSTRTSFYRSVLSDSVPDLASPLVSPMFGSFAGLPPLYLMVGESEVQRDDVIKAHRLATRSGGQAQVEVVPYCMQSYPVYCKVFPEARASLQRIKTFIARYVPLPPTLEADYLQLDRAGKPDGS
ncbi:Esterase [Diplonema papillatum]|nr:Esterase [Diplonema papillatum]|eukprot:gene16177-24790_t